MYCSVCSAFAAISHFVADDVTCMPLHNTHGMCSLCCISFAPNPVLQLPVCSVFYLECADLWNSCAAAGVLVDSWCKSRQLCPMKIQFCKLYRLARLECLPWLKYSRCCNSARLCWFVRCHSLCQTSCSLPEMICIWLSNLECTYIMIMRHDQSWLCRC